ncbi:MULTISPECIES: hypothetical protein [Microbacterium]|uniref:hypothetical protein n=1 Tax=Microbacterium TaxID=33882 RepID=UPI00344FAFEE
MKHTTSVILPGLITLLLTGCTSVDELTVATYTPTGEGGFGAQLVGSLTQSDAGCLTVTSDDSAAVPVFPEDAIAVDGESIVYNGQTFKLGDTISLTGGIATNQDLPEECSSGGDIFLVSADA